MNFKTVAATVILSALALTGCASGDAKTEQEAAKGKPEVHARIKAETNCDKLQKDFDLAVKNQEIASNNGKLELAQANTAYMTTALDRQNELKCFG